ncbi:unnamed protein product, partial [Iphiclides podalirius]
MELDDMLQELSQLTASEHLVPVAEMDVGDVESSVHLSTDGVVSKANQVDEGSVNAPDDLPTDTGTKLSRPFGKKRMTGAARRRFNFWVEQGFSREDATQRCRLPLAQFPEFMELGVAVTEGTKKTSKRPSSEEASPEEQPRKTGRLTVPTRTEPCYADVVCCFRVGITDANRAIVPGDGLLFEQAVLRAVDRETSGGPRIKGWTIRAGVIILTCENSATRDWLVARLDDLKPWHGAVLRLVDEKDLPKSVMVVAWIPDTNVDGKTLLHRLQVQNEEVGCNRWRVVNVKTDGNGQTYCFALDSLALPNLLKRGCALYLGCRLIQFRVKGLKTGSVREGSAGASGMETDLEGCSEPPVVASALAVSRPSSSQPGMRRAALGASVAITAGADKEPVPGPSSEPVPGPSYEPVPGPSCEPVPRPSWEPVPGPSWEPVPRPSWEPMPGPSREPSSGNPFGPRQRTGISTGGKGCFTANYLEAHPAGTRTKAPVSSRRRGLARSMVRGRSVQLVSLSSEHSSRKAEKNP